MLVFCVSALSLSFSSRLRETSAMLQQVQQEKDRFKDQLLTRKLAS